MVKLGSMLLALVLSIVIPVSVVLWLINIFIFTFYSTEGEWEPISPSRWVFAFVAPLYIAKTALHKRSLDQTGAAAAVIVGFVMIMSNYCFFASLITFFLTGTRVTKFRASEKLKKEADYKEGGQRDWKQVICNGGVATQLAILFMLDVGCGEPVINFTTHYSISWLCLAVLGALACSAGDTFASAIGSVVGDGDAILITSLVKVPKGIYDHVPRTNAIDFGKDLDVTLTIILSTNGGISLAGTLSSFVGGAMIGAAYHATLVLVARIDLLESCPPQWPLILVGGLAGFIGSMIDSLLGATLQYSGLDEKRKCVVEMPGPGVAHISGSAILDNHSVNLLASFITCLLTPHVGIFVWGAYT